MEEKYMKLGEVFNRTGDLMAIAESTMEDELCKEICDNYCKFPNNCGSIDELIEKHCNSCPLTKWI